MRLLLRIQDLHFADMPAFWWHDSQTIASILETIDRHGLGREFRFYGPSAKQRKKIPSREKLLEASKGWKAAAYELSSDDVPLPSLNLFLDLKVNALTLMLRVDQAFSAKHDGDIITQFVEIVADIYRLFGEGIMMGPVVDVELLDADYPKSRPPRFHRVFLPGVLATFVCRRFHARHRLAAPADVEQLLGAPLPDGATKSERGDLVILRWADDAKDPEQLMYRRSVHDCWLSDTLVMPIKAGYNVCGDHLIMPPGTGDGAITFYNAGRGEGFKAIVPMDDGSIDAGLISEMKSWIDARQLPGGQRLDRLNLILPARQSALDIRSSALEMGAVGTYYVDNDGYLWNPFPPGMWLDRSTD